MKQLQNAIELLLYFENIIFDNETAFVQQFCIEPKEVAELLSIYFSSDRIKFYYMSSSYETVTDEISFEEFESWVKVIVPDFLK
jgi:hypothetical protein